MADPSFLAWCEQHDVVSTGVQPGHVEQGWRGVIATQAIEPGTVIMRVPERLLMSVASAKRDPQLTAGLEHHQLNSHQVLAIHLLLEAARGASSFWAPYIQQLPRQYTTLLTWPRAAVQALQVPNAQEAAAAAQAKAQAEWAAARPAMHQLGLAKKWCSWRAWCWAASTVLSRAMYHPDDPACGCLTPLADLHNYAPPPAPYTPQLMEGAQQLSPKQQQQQQQQRRPGLHQGQLQQHTPPPQQLSDATASHSAGATCSFGTVAAGKPGQAEVCGDGYYDAQELVYKIVARRSYQPGDQVFLCYGRHTNLDLLELYGFMLPDNPHETAVLPLELVQQTVQQLQRRQHEQQFKLQARLNGRAYTRQPRRRCEGGCQLALRAADCYIHVDGQPSWELLKALRLVTATPHEVRTKGHLAHSGQPLSLESECVALTCIQLACQAQLALLPTANEQDKAEPQQSQLVLLPTTAGQIKAESCECTRSDGPCACCAVLSHHNTAGEDDVTDTDSSMKPHVRSTVHDCAMAQQHRDSTTVSGRGCAAVAAHQLPTPAQQQHVKQQLQHEQDCLHLAVRWRVAYKATLTECIRGCTSTVDALQSRCGKIWRPPLAVAKCSSSC